MIKEFQGKYRWLSNFYPVEVILDSITYPSIENAYQSAKSNDNNWKRYCQYEENPSLVKKESRKIDLIDNWNYEKVIIMRSLIEQKFDKEPFMSLLIDTNDVYIIEGNRWGDTFWGVGLYNDKGSNILGKMIMDKRKMLLIKNNKGLLFDIMKGRCNNEKHFSGQ